MENLIQLLFITLITIQPTVGASVTDEAMVHSAYVQGVNVYNSCIAIPPVTAEQLSYCTGIYTAYVATLSIVNAPFPLLPSTDPSPYVWSPFDICRYEVAHMVFNSVTQTPYYCPTL